MKITLSTRGRSGKFSRTISVTTNDPEHIKESLVCAGSVLAPFQMQPKSLNFGQVDRDSGTVRKIIKLTRGDGGPLAPELVPLEHKNIEASLREITPGEEYELDVAISPPWQGRTLSTNLTLKTGISESPEETIRLYARIAPRLRAEPARFMIPRNTQSDQTLKAQLVWSGGDPGNILEATASDPQMTVRVEEKDGRQTVVLNVPAGYSPPAKGRPVVTVKTDDPEVPTLRLGIYAPRTPATMRPSATGAKPGVKRVPTQAPKRPPAQPPEKPKP